MSSSMLYVEQASDSLIRTPNSHTFPSDGIAAETESSRLEKRLHVGTVRLRLGGRAVALADERAHQSQLRE